jgi:hypothetical protein
MGTASRLLLFVIVIGELRSESFGAPPVTGENPGDPSKRVFIPNSGYTRSTRAAHFRKSSPRSAKASSRCRLPGAVIEGT